MASRLFTTTRFLRAPLTRAVTRRGYASETHGAVKHAGEQFPEESEWDCPRHYVLYRGRP